MEFRGDGFGQVQLDPEDRQAVLSLDRVEESGEFTGSGRRDQQSVLHGDAQLSGGGEDRGEHGPAQLGAVQVVIPPGGERVVGGPGVPAQYPFQEREPWAACRASRRGNLLPPRGGTVRLDRPDHHALDPHGAARGRRPHRPLGEVGDLCQQVPNRVLVLRSAADDMGADDLGPVPPVRRGLGQCPDDRLGSGACAGRSTEPVGGQQSAVFVDPQHGGDAAALRQQGFEAADVGVPGGEEHDSGGRLPHRKDLGVDGRIGDERGR